MKVIVFDFDGVIIPSEQIKQHGYEWMFTEWGEVAPLDAIRAAREEFSNARGNRYDIIRSILIRTGRTEELDAAVEMYAERFNMAVSKRLNEFQVDRSVLRMLERLSKDSALYINSNTPDEPLCRLVDTLGIRAYFKGVFGSSGTKRENLRMIAEREGVRPSDVVFIGDGAGDLSAAREYGCEFVGIATDMNGWTKSNAEFRVLNSVADFRDRGDSAGERMV